MADQPPLSSHPPVTPEIDPHDHPEIARRNATIGLILFAVYFVFYAGFILITSFAFERMKTSVFEGVNLAVVYGFGLIIGAIVLAILYIFLCRGTEPGSSREGGRL